VIVLTIDINGDALKLLEHFIYYATGPYWENLANAMCYDKLGFCIRVRQLEILLENALDEDISP
jgi:hypothetical protein